jgi:hypothetical protein
MKPANTKIYFVITILIALSLNLTSCTFLLRDKSTAQSESNPKKIEAIKKINEIYKNSGSNTLTLMSILNMAKKDTINFDSYVYLANLVNEFGYNTLVLNEIAESVYHAKVETNYFKQLGDLAVMTLGDSYHIIKSADAISELNTCTNIKAEKIIQTLQKSANFKTMNEARAYNKSLNNKF